MKPYQLGVPWLEFPICALTWDAECPHFVRSLLGFTNGLIKCFKALCKSAFDIEG